MLDRGFYLMRRGWMDHPALSGKREPFCRRAAFAWLVENAAWQARQVNIAGRTITLDRGQLTASLRFLAAAWGWSEPSVRRFIERLKTDALIDAGTDAGQLVITICNYDESQVVGSATDAGSDAQSDAEVTQQRRKTKERKERKTLSVDEAGLFSLAGDHSKPKADDEAAFDAFWSVYPRKVGKPEARKAWKAATRKADPASIIAAASAYSEQTLAEKTEPRFIKHPGPWLNAERWADFQPNSQPDDDDFDRAFAVAQAAGPEALRAFINRHRPVAEQGDTL